VSTKEYFYPPLPIHFKVTKIVSLSHYKDIKPNNITGGGRIKEERDVGLHLPNAFSTQLLGWETHTSTYLRTEGVCTDGTHPDF
jgi:hypothetical protein